MSQVHGLRWGSNKGWKDNMLGKKTENKCVEQAYFLADRIKSTEVEGKMKAGKHEAVTEDE